MKKSNNKPSKQKDSKVKPIHIYKIQKSLQEDGFLVEIHLDKEIPLVIIPKKEK